MGNKAKNYIRVKYNGIVPKGYQDAGPVTASVYVNPVLANRLVEIARHDCLCRNERERQARARKYQGGLKG